MTYIVGLTGGIGSGKSAASAWFEQQEILVVDADIVAREVVEVGQPALIEIQKHFGDWVLDEQGCLNRSALRDYIFKHPEARQQLEAITHPVIRNSIIQQLNQALSPYAILASPLLFETDQHLLCQRSLLIDVPVELQLVRASQRDGQSREQIERIIAVQMPRLEKQKRAHDIVDNSGTLEDLYQQLQPLHEHYLQLATSI
uniref:dephospho-CoA kinase n=1 Tax=uncultured Acinetobacter sp. TaxID=165433 RepID=UPI0026309722|nr:dephospho-CoA kinase [uncultured Acinetobacter sp.]